VIGKPLSYLTLLVCWLWYRCGAPILRKRVELKEDGALSKKIYKISMWGRAKTNL